MLWVCWRYTRDEGRTLFHLLTGELPPAEGRRPIFARCGARLPQVGRFSFRSTQPKRIRCCKGCAAVMDRLVQR